VSLAENPITPDVRNAPGYPQADEIALDAFEPLSDAGRALLKFWNGLLRNKGGAPSFVDCDLLEISSLLPDCILLHFEGDEAWPIRMFGTGVATRFGMDATGLNALDTFQPAERPGVKHRIGVLRSRPAILNTVSVFTKESGLRLVSEWVFTPLLGESGAVEYGLASISPVEQQVPVDQPTLGGGLDDRRMLHINFISI